MRKKWMGVLLILGILCTGCGAQTQVQSQAEQSTQIQHTEVQDKATIVYSNMAGEESKQEVESALLSALPEAGVKAFMGLVSEYNTAIENTGLQDAFVKAQEPVYRVEQTDVLWAEKMGDYIGTNCRINTFTLLKDAVNIREDEKADAELLFLDHEAIEGGKLFSAEEKRKFDTLFARVPTEATKDVQVHAAKMKEHFAKIEFDKGARMLSVVMHDSLDGEYLFVGHVGVLVQTGESYLFVEKLSFQEPYQAIRFAEPEDAYTYLLNKYALDYGQETAKAFIMDNDSLVKY